MKLIAPHHKKSNKVTFWNLKEAVKQATEVCTFLDEGNNQKFKGAWKRAYALSHCQVTEEPFNFFVVSEDLLRKGQRQTRTQNKRNWFFRSKVIFNPEIIKAEAKDNTFPMVDGCMSYPQCTAIKVERYLKVTVKYKILRSLFGFQWLSTVTEEVTGLKSHIFQHEVDHSYGIDIMRGDGVDKNPIKPYAKGRN